LKKQRCRQPADPSSHYHAIVLLRCLRKVLLVLFVADRVPRCQHRPSISIRPGVLAHAAVPVECCSLRSAARQNLCRCQPVQQRRSRSQHRRPQKIPSCYLLAHPLSSKWFCPRILQAKRKLRRALLSALLLPSYVRNPFGGRMATDRRPFLSKSSLALLAAA